MASATKQSETVETIKSVTLELTPEEARTLAVVLVKVGGSPWVSPRKHGNNVLGALREVGITYRGAPEYDLIEDNSSYQGLYFSDYPMEG